MKPVITTALQTVTGRTRMLLALALALALALTTLLAVAAPVLAQEAQTKKGPTRRK